MGPKGLELPPPNTWASELMQYMDHSIFDQNYMRKRYLFLVNNQRRTHISFVFVMDVCCVKLSLSEYSELCYVVTALTQSLASSIWFRFKNGALYTVSMKLK